MADSVVKDTAATSGGIMFQPTPKRATTAAERAAMHNSTGPTGRRAPGRGAKRSATTAASRPTTKPPRRAEPSATAFIPAR